MKPYLPIAILMLLGVGEAAQQKAETRNMDLVGYNDLQARSAYQPTIHEQGGRWIAYVGHHGGFASSNHARVQPVGSNRSITNCRATLELPMTR